MLDKYKVFIGTGTIIEGSETGNANINFDKDGLYIHFPNSSMRSSPKAITNLQIKTIQKQEMQKGSMLAKVGMFMTATNDSKNIDPARKISATMALSNLANDKLKLKELTCCLVQYGSKSVNIVLDRKEDQHKISLAFSNPKKFFQKSITEAWSADLKTGGWILFLVFFPIWFLLFIRKIFVKRKWKSLVGTENYNQILNNL